MDDENGSPSVRLPFAFLLACVLFAAGPVAVLSVCAPLTQETDEPPSCSPDLAERVRGSWAATVDGRRLSDTELQALSDAVDCIEASARVGSAHGTQR